MTHHLKTRGLFAAAAVAAVLLSAGAGCELITAIDRTDIASGGGTTTSTAMGGAGGATSVGGAGGNACNPANCPGTVTDCSFPGCDANDMCDMQQATVGAACTDGPVDAKVCDNMGACVECNVKADCGADECVGGTCVPAQCTDTVMNGEETDVDCGGTSCPSCTNGGVCAAPTDCESGFCDGTNVCAPCAGPADCAATDFCDTTAGGVCTPDKAVGQACADSDECVLGNCADGFCCGTACAGGGCESCGLAGTEGTCTPQPVGTDPDAFCADQGMPSCGTDGACDGAGACRLYAAATPCGTSCAGTTQTNNTCDGAGVCGAGGTASCGDYNCGATTCLTTCTTQAECSNATHACSPGGMCRAGLDGDVCGSGGQCVVSAFCVADVLNVPRCKSNKMAGAACALPSECATHNCTGNVCVGNGDANDACSMAYECASNNCAGTLCVGAAGGVPCTRNEQCLSASCGTVTADFCDP